MPRWQGRKLDGVIARELIVGLLEPWMQAALAANTSIYIWGHGAAMAHTFFLPQVAGCLRGGGQVGVQGRGGGGTQELCLAAG